MSLLFQILSVIVLFQLAFISFFLLTNKKGRGLSNVLLAGFFLSLMAGLLDFILLQFDIFDTYHQYAFVLNSLVIFHPPLLLLYTQSLTQSQFRLQPIHLLHASAFLLSIGLLIPFYCMKSDEVQGFVIEGLEEGEATVFIVISVVGLFYELSYLIAIKLELKAYRKRILDRFSNIDRINFSWLHYVVNIFIVSFIANSIASFIRHTSMDNLDEAAVIFGLVGFFFFINSVLLKGLHQNEVFLGPPTRSTAMSINAEKRQVLIETLQGYMVREKPYLKSDLTIEQLGEQIKISSRELSTLINSELGQTFFDMINSYRIAEAKDKMANSSDPKTTISEIMYKVGFNSKYSFNTAFKKFTGTTPTMYKANLS